MENARIRWLAGCWDLVESTFTAGDGAVREPWGAAPIGVLLVTPSGELSAHGGRRDRAALARVQPTSDEKQLVYDDYFSYHGHIVRVDDQAGTFVTLVEGATDPAWIGGEQLRYLDIEDDDSIVLRTPPLAMAGGAVVGRFAWSRRVAAREAVVRSTSSAGPCKTGPHPGIREEERPVKARAQIDPGICCFDTIVTAETEDGRYVTFEFDSECEIIQEFAAQIREISPVDAIATLGPQENPILQKARELLRTIGCCEACIVPAGALKTMYVATVLALPKDVTLQLTKNKKA
jgi:hypothetical protein